MKFSILHASAAFICFQKLQIVVCLSNQGSLTSGLGEIRLNVPLFLIDDVNLGSLSKRSMNKENIISSDKTVKEGTCEFWLKELDEWGTHSDEWKSNQGYRGKGVLLDQRMGGAGDLLAGTMTGLIEAISKRTKLFLLAPDFRDSFEISDAIPKDMVELVSADSIPSNESYDSCHVQNFSGTERLNALEFNCDFDLHKQYDCYHYNWFCMPKPFARHVKREYALAPNPVDVVGCPMRLFYSMSKTQASHRIPWVNGGKRSRGTFQSLQEIVKQYQTIAVHFRGGDKLFHNKHSVKTKLLLSVNKTLLCAHSVAGMIEDNFKSNLDIRFIVASDTPVIRDMLLDAFPDNVIMIEEQPTHLADIHNASKELDMFAEWFLLGQADFMIQNIFMAWPSSFSTTARLYHLKSDYFEVSKHNGMCMWKDYDYKGNLAKVKSLFPASQPREQLHVESCRKRFGDKACFV